MTTKRLIALLAGPAAVALIAITGCGGGATASQSPPEATGGRAATVGVAATRLGKTLVDSKGRTLYRFRKDSGTKSTCFGECANDWPPLRGNGKPTAGQGATASLVGTTARSDGAPQVTYNGHPLYLYEGDQNAGDTNGQGLTAFGDEWFALSPAGNQLSGQSSNSDGGSGY